MEITSVQQSSQEALADGGTVHELSKAPEGQKSQTQKSGNEGELQSDEDAHAKNDPELTSDAELDAFIENVLGEGPPEAGSTGEGFEDFEDLDEYLDQLNSEEGADTDPVEIVSADFASYQSGQTTAIGGAL